MNSNLAARFVRAGNHSTISCGGLVCLALAALFALGCDQAASQRTDAPAVAVAQAENGQSGDKAKSTDDKAEPAADDAKEEADDDPGKPKKPAMSFDVPNASPAELMEYIRNVPGLVESRDDLEKAGLSIITASEQILSKEPDEEQKRFAVANMLNALHQLHDNYRREMQQTQRYWKQQTSTLVDDKDPHVANLALRYQLLYQANVWASLSDNVKQGFTESLQKFFAGTKLDSEDLSLAFSIGDAVVEAGDRNAAIAIYATLGEIFSTSSDPGTAAEARKLTGWAFRLSQFGEPLELEGTLLNHKPLDWKSYRGKVVLVDFWATWCGPCIAEMPLIKKLYESYHDRGFDVVGISMDDDPDSVKEFVAKNQIPWSIVFNYGDGDSHPGLESPLALQFGVNSIPVALLVDQEGKLVSLEARGSELVSQVERLLGVKQPAKEEEKQAEPEQDAEQPGTEKSDAEKADASEKSADEKTTDEQPETKPTDEKTTDEEPAAEEKPAAGADEKAPGDEIPANENLTDEKPADAAPPEPATPTTDSDQ